MFLLTSDCLPNGSDIQLVFDLSSDAGDIGFETYLEAGEYIIKNLNLSDEMCDIAISTFDENFSHVVPFRSGKSNVELSLTLISLRMGLRQHNICAATLIQRMNETIIDKKKRNIIIIFTQGYSIADIGESFHAFRNVSGARMATLGHGKGVHVANHMAMAFDPALRFFIGEELYNDVHVLSAFLQWRNMKLVPNDVKITVLCYLQNMCKECDSD